MTPTANQRHREQAFILHRDSLGLVRCALRGREGHECGGRLQAHHSISKQTLKRLHAQALRGQQLGGIRPAWEERLAALTLDELIADGRNSDVTCEIRGSRVSYLTNGGDPETRVGTEER